MVFEGINIHISPEGRILMGGWFVAACCAVWLVVTWLRRDGK
jgi:hypothetical protein